MALDKYSRATRLYPQKSFRLPNVTTTQRNNLDVYEGLHVYDTTLGKDYIYRAGGWGETGGTSAGSLDAAYNGGVGITVDAGAVALTDTQTATGGGLLITKSGAITGADSASVFHINSTGAHDTSGDVKFLEISVGSETITGSVYGIEIEMNANTDSALEITKGAVVVTDGALTLTSGNFAMTGDATITGGATISTTLDVTGNSTFGGTLAVAGAQTNQGAFIIDVDNAEAFLIRENGDAADVFTIDTTQDAGDTTALLTTKVTTGTGMHIDGSTVTTGDALKITVAAATMTAAGAAISVVADGTEVFAVRDDGSFYSKATAEGTTAFEVVTGDVVLDDGDLTVSGGECAFTSDANAAGVVITNNTITTANQIVGVSSTSISTGAVMTLNANTTAHDGEILELISAGDATSTPTGMSVTIGDVTTGAAKGIDVVMAKATTTAKGISVTMDAITTGDMLYLDAGGATMTEGTGTYINCNDDDTSQFTVGRYGETTIAGKAAGTAALTLDLGDIILTDSDASKFSSVNGTGTLLTLDNAGGAIADNSAVLLIDAGGTPAAAGSNLLRVAFTGTDTNKPTLVEVVGGGKDCMGLSVDADPTTTSAVVFTSQGALAANKATLEVSSDVASCNADSAVVRITQDSTTGVATCMALVQDDVSQPFITLETTIGAGNAIEEVGGKTLTTTHFIMVDIEGVGARYFPVGTIA